MNILHSIHTEYLRPSRTIETVLVSDDVISKTFFIYNYEGNSFRVFLTYLDLLDFFESKTEPDIHFNTEDQLDFFLQQLKL